VLAAARPNGWFPTDKGHYPSEPGRHRLGRPGSGHTAAIGSDARSSSSPVAPMLASPESRRDRRLVHKVGAPSLRALTTHHAAAIDYFCRTAGTTARADTFAFRDHVAQMELADVDRDVAAAVAWPCGTAKTTVTVGFCLWPRPPSITKCTF
jgi:hypothetical protein